MRKYEEKKYLFENIKDHIYPWVKEELRDSKAQNGKIGRASCRDRVSAVV